MPPILPKENAPTGAKSKPPQYVVPRGGVYQFKRRIPAAVVRALELKSDQFTRSLKSSDLEVALRSLHLAVEEYEQLVASATQKKGGKRNPKSSDEKRGEGTTKYLLIEHIPQLLERFKHAHLETDDQERKVMSRAEREDRLAMLVDGLEGPKGLYEQAASENYRHMEEVAQLMLTEEKLLAPPGSKVRERLLRELLAKDIQVMEIQRDRLLGRMTLTPSTAPVAPRNLLTLLNLFQAWQATQKEVRTIEAYQGVVDDFEGMVGALPVIAITKEHVFQFRDTLVGRELVRETVKNRVGALSTIVRYGQREGLVALLVNPFENVSFSHISETPDHEKRRAFEVHELNQLFSSPVYSRNARPTGQTAESSFWMPLIGPFVGARNEEIAQLRVEDVQCINGDWALRIANLSESQHLKNESSYRLVPIHEELVRCGFLAHVERVKKAGHTLVFPSHKNENKYKRFGNAFGKWFGGYLGDIGLDDPRLDYHSFRFTFKQQCSICGIGDEVRDALTGHWLSKNDAGRGYMRAPERQYPFPVLVQAMKTLSYGELDLTHLHC